MRHLAVIISFVLLAAPGRTAAAAQSGDHDIGQDRRPRVTLPRPPVRTPAPAEDLVVPATPTPQNARVIATDGAVETTMPDGSVRRARPGVCGWTIVHPNGRTNTLTCMSVRRADLPAPDTASAAWLMSHGDSLLEIARKLLGSNAPSLENYLKTVESDGPGVYERIRLRTELIAMLTGQ